jgi:hypothetical protein
MSGHSATETPGFLLNSSLFHYREGKYPGMGSTTTLSTLSEDVVFYGSDFVSPALIPLVVELSITNAIVPKGVKIPTPDQLKEINEYKNAALREEVPDLEIKRSDIDSVIDVINKNDKKDQGVLSNARIRGYDYLTAYHLKHGK